MLSKKAWFVEIQVQLDTFCLKYIKYTIILCTIKTEKILRVKL